MENNKYTYNEISLDYLKEILDTHFKNVVKTSLTTYNLFYLSTTNFEKVGGVFYYNQPPTLDNNIIKLKCDVDYNPYIHTITLDNALIFLIAEDQGKYLNPIKGIRVVFQYSKYCAYQDIMIEETKEEKEPSPLEQVLFLDTDQGFSTYDSFLIKQKYVIPKDPLNLHTLLTVNYKGKFILKRKTIAIDYSNFYTFKQSTVRTTDLNGLIVKTDLSSEYFIPLKNTEVQVLYKSDDLSKAVGLRFYLKNNKGIVYAVYDILKEDMIVEGDS